MNGEGNTLEAAEVSLAATTVHGSIAIQQLLPVTELRDANTVVLSDDGSKVAHEKQLLVRIPTTPQETDDASLIIVAVDPGKTSGIEVELMQCGLVAIQGVQVAHPVSHCRVER